MSTRLIPPTTELTAPYWQAAQRGELMIQHCSSCGAWSFPPRAHCGMCGADGMPWEKVSGTGSIYTFTISHRPPHPVFAEQCPLVIAVVELEEGPRLMTNIVGCEPDELEIGQPVQVDFEPIDDSELKLPVFRPA